MLITSDGIKLYEVKAGKMFRPDFKENMDYLKRLIPNVKSATVIYDGESLPPISLNIRDI